MNQTRVLIADEDAIFRELVATSLTSSGYLVDHACSGEDTVRQVASGDYNLVIISVGAPAIDGFQALRHIRKTDRTSHLPVIVVAGHDDLSSIESGLAAGASSFLTKPINWSLFQHQIQYVLRSSREESDIRDAKQMLEIAGCVKSNLLSVASEEFRNPLHVVRGFTERLLDNERDFPEPALCRDYALKMRHAVDRLDRVLQDMLQFSRAVSDDLELHDEHHLACELVRDVVQAHIGRANSRRICLTLRSGMEDTISLDCDRALISRCLEQLLDNAIKFSPPASSIIVTMELAEDGAFVCRICDEGPGIPMDLVEVYLQPFVQGDMNNSRSQEGLGIGLAISEAIARLHEGRLEIVNNQLDGITAKLVLPSHRVERALPYEPLRAANE